MKLAHTSAMLLGGLAIAVSTSALAGVDIGINLGPPVVVAPGPGIIIGWHGDRYWDGRRYWGRDDWYRHHPGHGHWDHGDRDHDRGHGHWH